MEEGGEVGDVGVEKGGGRREGGERVDGGGNEICGREADEGY